VRKSAVVVVVEGEEVESATAWTHQPGVGAVTVTVTRSASGWRQPGITHRDAMRV